MEDGYIGEIRMFGGNFAPKNWYFCNGGTVPISSNQTLYAIIGSSYGGDGRTTLGLPNFQGIFPMGFSPNHPIGSRGGSESQVITQANLPAHNHPLMASNSPGNLNNPTGALLGNTGGFDSEYVRTGSGLVEMAPNAIGPSGNGQALYTMPPYSVVSFIICHTGIFPSRP